MHHPSIMPNDVGVVNRIGVHLDDMIGTHGHSYVRRSIMKVLDVEAVQAFVLVADFKSFTRAAEALDTTQSAISLKIKRLEEVLGRRLLERTPRLVRLSTEGMDFLASARELLAAHQSALNAFVEAPRRLKVGFSHHIIGAELASLLAQLKAAQPYVLIELRISTSKEALEAFDHGLLDAAFVLRHDNRRLDGDIVLKEAFAWTAGKDFVQRANAPLALATQAEPCSVRRMAIAALDEAGIAWSEVFVGGGVLAIGAAVSAGLAVAALARRVAPPGTRDVGPILGLPPLPSRDVVMYSNATDVLARRTLSTLCAAMRGTIA